MMAVNPAKPVRNTWIIGASAGIGAALARELATRGERLALSARDGGALEALRQSLPSPHDASEHGGNSNPWHQVVPLDVRDNAAVIRARDTILSHFGSLDRAVFMAGVYQPMTMGELDLTETRTILDVNLMGAFHVAEALIPVLRTQYKHQQRRAQLAFCASVAGYRGLPNSQPYGASKAGLINMVQSLRIEQHTMIDVRLINPGFVESRLTDKNTFAMPMRMRADDAAKALANGLEGTAFEVHFPKRFTLFMKFLALLPHGLYESLITRAK